MRTRRNTPAAALDWQFVEFVPQRPSAGMLYVSIANATAIHLCCCGCGREVVTPLAPNGWSLTFDGDTVSLHPSIGNWSFPCQSHYWIRGSRVEWVPAWSAQEVRANRRRLEGGLDARSARNAGVDQAGAAGGKRLSWWTRLKHLLTGD